MIKPVSILFKTSLEQPRGTVMVDTLYGTTGIGKSVWRWVWMNRFARESHDILGQTPIKKNKKKKSWLVSFFYGALHLRTAIIPREFSTPVAKRHGRKSTLTPIKYRPRDLEKCPALLLCKQTPMKKLCEDARINFWRYLLNKKYNLAVGTWSKSSDICLLALLLT